MTTHAADAAIPQIVDLGYLLTGHTFTITDFQRDYEWEPTKAVDLFAGYRDDLAKGLPITLLGVISAYHNADGSLAVTDGQQRLTTVLIAAAAAMRSSLARSGGTVGGELACLLEATGFGQSGRPRVAFPHTPGGDGTYAELCRQTPAPFPRPAGNPTSHAMLANAAALRHWFDTSFDDPHEPVEMFKQLLPRLRAVLQILPSRQIGIRDYIRLNCFAKVLQQGALVKNVVISYGDTTGTTDKTAAAWARFEAGAGGVDEREKRLVYALSGTYGRGEALARKHIFEWFNANVETVAADTDPAGFAGWLADRSDEFTATTRRGVDERSDPRIKLLARMRPSMGAHTILVAAAGGLDKELFAHACYRVAGLTLLTSTLKKRGADLNTALTDAADAVVTLAAGGPSRDALDAIFDRAAQRIVHGSSHSIVDTLATTRFGDRTGLDALSVLSFAALTFEPAGRQVSTLDAVMSGRYQVEHIWPVAGEVWDASNDRSVQVLVAPGDERMLLGNLTLLAAAENGAASNRPYVDKLAFYGAESMTMTRVLSPHCDPAGFTRAVENEVRAARDAVPTGPWTAEKIAARSRDIARRALRSAGYSAP